MKTKVSNQAGHMFLLLVRTAFLGLVASTGFSTLAWAQQGGAADCETLEGAPPGLYATADQGRVFMIKGNQVIELAPGDAAYANQNKMTCINRVPQFLDWPCASDAAQSRKFTTYSIDELTGDDILKQVVRRYFEIPEVIQPVPNWLEGEYSDKLPLNEILPYTTAEYWYRPNTKVDIMNEKRPKTLLISLYVGINQVVIDNYTIEELKKYYAGEPISVVFVFNDSNAVPVSYFGPNVSLEELHKAFNERHIKLAEVPMWSLGDYHLLPSATEFEKYFDLPSLDEIDGMRREALAAELETYGFTRKPIFVTMIEDGNMYLDDPDRVRVAISMGLKLPTVINFVEQDSYMARCGPGTPTGSSGVSGSTTPQSGAILTPGSPITPPPTDPAPPDRPVSPS